MLEAGADRKRADGWIGGTAADIARRHGLLDLADMIDRFKVWPIRHAGRRQTAVQLATNISI